MDFSAAAWDSHTLRPVRNWTRAILHAFPVCPFQRVLLQRRQPTERFLPTPEDGRGWLDPTESDRWFPTRTGAYTGRQRHHRGTVPCFLSR